MPPERWQKIEQFYHAALEREPNERNAFLAEACNGDDELRREVESLLAQETQAELFLESPALEVAAKALAENQSRSLIGQQLGTYKIGSLLGAGGMGEVYQAHDIKLGRDVAIKVLPSVFTHDPERLSRFQREARMLAALNHPNIATIHGLEHSDGVHYLVMELVPGETLAERISKGRLPLQEALKIAGEMAKGLEAAHERGVIHRDLKPANVKVTAEGRVKVLDFGLAKAFAGDGTTDVSKGPTQSEEGRILGTPAYMSPEQARGKPVDKRTDIWAFGCVVYELLTAEQAFRGETQSDTIAAVLEREPDWQVLPLTIPAKIRDLLRRSLQKDLQRRLRDIGDARVEMEDALTATPDSASEPRKAQSLWMWGVAAMLIALGLGLGWTLAHFRQTEAEIRTLQLTVAPPPGTEFRLDSGVAISPNGRTLAFVGRSSGGDQLWVRPLDSLNARRLPNTDGAMFPFWSPDGRSLGFFATGKLKRVDVAGGLPAVICDVPSGRGGTWNAEGIIVFNAVNDGPLLRVSADGGTPIPLTLVDSTQHENSHRWPQFLPGGKRFLYFIRGRGSAGTDSVYMGTLDQPREKIRLLSSSTNALYAPDRDKNTGHLFWVRDGTLIAQAFDPNQGQLRGEAVMLAENVGYGEATRLATVSASNDGTLLYGGTKNERSQLTWYGRDGKPLGHLGEPDRYGELQISPDYKRVALTRLVGGDVGANIWQMEVARGIPTLVTLGQGSNPVWSPDSSQIAYVKGAPPNLFSRGASGTGPEERLIESHDTMILQDWSPDGKFLLYLMQSNDLSLRTPVNLWLLPMSGDRKPVPFLTTPFQEGASQFSPDGKWIAYTSDESGRNEVFVHSFPADGFKVQVSSKGGDWVRWRKDSKELYYIAPDRKIMSVAVRPINGALELGTPNALFTIPLAPGSVGNAYITYDVMPDGQSFLALAPEAEAAAPPINVVLNWQAEHPVVKK